MDTRPGGDAMRLLRAINAYQAHGRVSSDVLPRAIASAAGLEPVTRRYGEALWRLLVGGGRSAGHRTGPPRQPCACWGRRKPLSTVGPTKVLRSLAEGGHVTGRPLACGLDPQDGDVEGGHLGHAGDEEVAGPGNGYQESALARCAIWHMCPPCWVQ